MCSTATATPRASEWIREAGLLTTPIAITNTHSVGAVRDALIAEERAELGDSGLYWCMPVVMETFDGLLNDIWGQHVGARRSRRGAGLRQSGPVREGFGGRRYRDDLPRVQGWHR
ncbi:P1 family peptidase [Pseudomonas aeruginosa]